jgi:hypothetical protein
MKLIERSICPCCQSDQFEIVYTISYLDSQIRKYLFDFYKPQGNPNLEFLDLDYVLARCNKCELLFQKYIPDDISLIELYSEWINKEIVFDKYEKYRDISYLQRNFLLLNQAIEYLEIRGITHFDYGFGYGNLLLQSKIFGNVVIGNELNVNQVDLAIKNGIKTINFPNDLKVQFITIEQVLEHCADLNEIMINIKSLCNKGTLVHVSVPDAIDFVVMKNLNKINWVMDSNYRKNIMPIAPLEHINSFTRDSLVYLFNKWGFRLVNMKSNLVINRKYLNFYFICKTFVIEIRNLIKNKFRKNTVGGTELFFEFID